MVCSNILDSAPDSLVGWVHGLNTICFEAYVRIREKMEHYAIPQLLFLQMIMLKVDSAYAWYVLSIQTAG